MVHYDTLEGFVNGNLWFHYDVGGDVLCLRVAEHLRTPTIAELTAEEFLLLRREDNNEAIGVTVVGWWKQFGKGELPDSLAEMGRWIEGWSQEHRIAA